MDDIKNAFRGLILRPIRPLEDRDGLRIGEDCRVYKETKDKKKKGFGLAFLQGTTEKRRKQIRDQLDLSNVEFVEEKDFKD